MNSYKTYIFDLDGTITNTMAVWLDIFKEALPKFDVIVPDDKTLIKHTHNWNEMTKLGLAEEKLPDFTIYIHAQAHKHLPEAQFHIGAFETLESLKNNGKKISIFSSMDRPLFEPAMKYRNLNSIIDIAIAGTDVPHRKPKPDGILQALELLKVPQNEYQSAVYVGDKETDIQAARSAGIKSILYYPASHQLMYDLDELKLHKPDHIITDWAQLLT